MLRGLWEFRPINQKTLGFLMNDELLFLDSHARDKNWLRVASIHGHVGYVPINFVELLENVDLGRLLGFLDEAIRRARQDRNRSLECLLTFRDSLVASNVSPDDMIVHMEAEIRKLRAKSISELSNENSNLRSSYQSSEAQEVSYASSVQTAKSVGGGASGRGGADVEEGGSPKAAAYHSSSSRSHHHHHHSESGACASHSGHLHQQHSFETDPLFASPAVAAVEHRHGSGRTQSGEGHSGHHTKSRGKKHKKQQQQQQQQQQAAAAASSATVISSIPMEKPVVVASGYTAPVVDLPHHPSDYISESCAGQGARVPESVVPGYSDMAKVVVDTGSMVISSIDDVEIVPPPPLPNETETEMQQFLQRHAAATAKLVAPEPCIVEPPSYFGTVPDLTSQPRKWSIASGDKPMDPKLMAGEMVDVVRSATGLPHKKCQMAAQVVLGYISECMTDLPTDLVSLMRHLDNPRAISENLDVIAHSSDTHSLMRIFRFLKKCQADEQQRSWALHEDESVILEHLHELNKILEDADPSICRYALEQDKYSTVSTLVLYYQMETRWSIRSKLIDCFGALCKIDLTALSVLLNSILPMELAREIRESLGDTERLTHCASLLFLILQTGEKLPISHYEHLGMDFLNFVYDVIESPPDDNEAITDIFANVVFALNLQWQHIDDNLTIKALAERNNAKVFTQKIIYYLNREVDPINVLELDYSSLLKKPQHSVFKMTKDILSCKRTTDLFYTNDIKVLIDIVTRNLTDLGPGESRRTLYLQMIQRIIRNSNYAQHMHRIEDLRSCLVSILVEEDLQALPDQIVIRDMAKEFSFLF